MISLMSLLFGWMPLPLAIICTGVLFFFVVGTLLHLIKFILDLIPFL